MPAYVVAIGANADELSIDARIALADAGFQEAAQMTTTKAAWPGELGLSGLDIPDELLEVGRHRIVYRYDALDSASAASDALAIVGDRLTVHVKAL